MFLYLPGDIRNVELSKYSILSHEHVLTDFILKVSEIIRVDTSIL